MRQILLIMLIFIGFAFAQEKDHIAAAELIKGLLNDSVELYKQGRADEAKMMSDSVYFQHFESMEGDISINLGRKAYKMERKQARKNRADFVFAKKARQKPLHQRTDDDSDYG